MEGQVAKFVRKGYREGSLLRIKMVNFLTYDECEVFPGPKLNVLIGPNGTGKSSISAAICLVLCGNPKLIGRSTDLSTFVNSKSDKDDAWIEVDILGKSEIVCIRRGFTRKSKMSKFLLDNRPSTQKKVQEIVKDMRITFDNLCAYMPQDRVGEFTMMDGKQLLEETLKVVRDPSSSEEQTMYDQLKSLTQLQETELNHDDSRRDLHDAVQRIQQQMELMAGEVQRMNERQEKERNKLLYEKKKCYLEFQEKKEMRSDLLKQKEDAQSELNKARSSLRPIEERKRSARTSLQRAELALKNCKGGLPKDFIAQVKKCDEDARNAIHEMRTLQQHKLEAKRKLNEEKSSRNALENKLNSLREKIPELKAQKAQLSEESSQRVKELSGIQEDIYGQERISSQCVDELRRIQLALRSLNDSREEMIRKLSTTCSTLGRNAIDALRWIEENRSRFTGHVKGPVALELKLEDRNIAAMVERCIPFNMLMAFTCETQEDLQLLRSEFRVGRRWALDFYKIQNTRVPNRNNSAETMSRLKASFGVQGYVDEKMICHPLISGLLNSFKGFHKVMWAVIRSETLSDEALSAIMGDTNSAQVFVLTPDSSILEYSLKKSRYNPRGKPSSSMRQVNPAKILAKSEDNDAQRTALERRAEEFNEKHRVVNVTLCNLRSRESAVQDAISTLTRRIHAITAEQRSENNLLQRIGLSDRKIADLEQLLSRNEDEGLKAHQNNLRTAIYSCKRTLENWQGSLRQDLETRVLIRAKEIETELALRVFENVSKELAKEEGKLQDLQDALDNIAQKLLEVEANLRRAKALIKNEMAPKDKDEYDCMMALPGATLTEVIEFITDLEAELSATRENFMVLREYERLQNELSEKQQKLKQVEQEVSETHNTLRTCLDSFNVNVEHIADKLNARFGNFMDGMGYKGAINMAREGKLNDWKIVPVVSFRRSERVSPLSAQRNSGGERAVSTIMYLMSLQDLAACPVRVVDEINQGMDERNERLVFERIVMCTSPQQSANADSNATSRRDVIVPQYFYISPKLLPALTSMKQDHVTLLLVFNGPGLLCKFTMEQFLRRRNSETSIEEEDEQDEGSQQQSETRISKRNSLSSRPGGRIKKQKTQSESVSVDFDEDSSPSRKRRLC